LCNADYECPIKLVLADGGNQSVYETLTTVGEISNGKSNFELAQGSLQIGGFKMEKEYTLVDYLTAGWQLSLFVGIDFTGSNGDPKNPESLHYLSSEN